MTPPPPERILVGGIPAFNEEHRVARAIRSLLDGPLPEGFRWGTIWVAASGCSDRTAERARATDPRVRVIEQPVRLGKASGLREIFRRAEGEYLVLLNADATAEREAVLRMVLRAEPLRGPFVVVAREIPEPSPTAFQPASELLWELHHQFHVLMAQRGTETNPSDQLILLPLGRMPPLPEDVVNDGGFIGGWLRSVGGTIAYAPEATLSIEVPQRLIHHVRQRRRIRWGLVESRERTGVAPTTFQGLVVQDPSAALRLLRSSMASVPHAGRALLLLAVAELMASLWAFGDRATGRANHRLWWTLPEPPPGPSGVPADRTSPRGPGNG